MAPVLVALVGRGGASGILPGAGALVVAWTVVPQVAAAVSGTVAPQVAAAVSGSVAPQVAAAVSGGLFAGLVPRVASRWSAVSPAGMGSPRGSAA